MLIVESTVIFKGAIFMRIVSEKISRGELVSTSIWMRMGRILSNLIP